MTHGPAGQLKQSLSRALLILALPVACAVGVEPEAGPADGTDNEGGSSGASSTGGTPGASGSGVVPKAGSTSTSGSGSNPFGGSSSTGGMSSAGSAGKPSGGSAGSAGSSSAGAGGAGGSGGGSAGSAGSGGAGGVCACPKKIPWVDMTTINFVTGDCFTLEDKLFAYVGTKMQTWAHPDCKPTMQLSWCADMGSDYKFTPCD